MLFFTIIIIVISLYTNYSVERKINFLTHLFHIIVHDILTYLYGMPRLKANIRFYCYDM